MASCDWSVSYISKLVRVKGKERQALWVQLESICLTCTWLTFLIQKNGGRQTGMLFCVHESTVSALVLGTFPSLFNLPCRAGDLMNTLPHWLLQPLWNASTLMVFCPSNTRTHLGSLNNKAWLTAATAWNSHISQTPDTFKSFHISELCSILSEYSYSTTKMVCV